MKGGCLNRLVKYFRVHIKKYVGTFVAAVPDILAIASVSVTRKTTGVYSRIDLALWQGLSNLQHWVTKRTIVAYSSDKHGKVSLFLTGCLFSVLATNLLLFFLDSPIFVL